MGKLLDTTLPWDSGRKGPTMQVHESEQSAQVLAHVAHSSYTFELFIFMPYFAS